MDIRGESVCDKDAKLQRKEFVRRVYHVYSVLLGQDSSQASGGRVWAGPRIYLGVGDLLGPFGRCDILCS